MSSGAAAGRPPSLRGDGEVAIIVDGQPLAAVAGQSVAAVLLASGRRSFRTSSRLGEPRGPYCNIGMCFDCVMTIDGQPNVRTCQTPVAAGMRVQTQVGDGVWSVAP